MEGYKPEKKKNSWAEAMKVASLAAGLSVVPMADNLAEAQNQKISPIENKYEARAESIRETVGTVKMIHLQEQDNSIPGQKYPGNFRYLNFSIVLDDEGVVDLVGIELPQGVEIPFHKDDQLTVKYWRREGPHNSFKIIEIKTEDGKILQGFGYG